MIENITKAQSAYLKTIAETCLTSFNKIEFLIFNKT